MITEENQSYLHGFREQLKIINENIERHKKRYEGFLCIDHSTSVPVFIYKILFRLYYRVRYYKATKDLGVMSTCQKEFEEIYACLFSEDLRPNKLLPGAINGFNAMLEEHRGLILSYCTSDYNLNSIIRCLEECYKISYSRIYQ